MTEEELRKVKFKFVCHLSMDHEYTTTYQSEDGRLGICDHTPYKDGHPHGRSYRHYRIDGKVYKTKEKFLEAIKDYSPNK